VVARLIAALGATRTRTVGELLDVFRAVARELEVARRHQRAAGRPAKNRAQDCMALILALEPVVEGRRTTLDWKRAAERLGLDPAARWARRLEDRARRLMGRIDDAVAQTAAKSPQRARQMAFRRS
jgi:hypothetical protein